jgi:hypothetical protein
MPTRPPPPRAKYASCPDREQAPRQPCGAHSRDQVHKPTFDRGDVTSWGTPGSAASSRRGRQPRSVAQRLPRSGSASECESILG